MTLLFCALAFAVAGFAFDGKQQRPDVSAERSAPWRALWIVAAALFATLLAGESLVTLAAFEQEPFPPWLRGIRYVPILETAPLYAHTPPAVSLGAESLALLAALLLGALAFALRGVSGGASLDRFSFLCAAIMSAVSLGSRGLTSSDLYAYVAYAERGIGAYHAFAIAPDGPLAIVGHLWVFEMLPAAYGPAWLWIVHALAGRTSIDTSILVLRLFSVASLVAVLLALRALGLSGKIVALVALDPAIYEQYVVDGHNDLLGIALLLWARVLARRGFPVAAIAAAAAAGACKAPFLALAPLAFFDAPALRTRLTGAGLAVASGVAASLAFGGIAYPRAIATVAAIFPASAEPGGALLPRMTLCATLGLILAAVLARRTGWPGSWSFVSLGSLVFPWYVIWGVPYAVLDPRRAVPFLASFPIAAFALSTTYGPSWALAPLEVALAIAAALIAYRRWRAPRTARDGLLPV